LEAMLLTVSR